MNGIPRFITFPVNVPRTPTSPLMCRVVRRRRAQSESSSVVPLPMPHGSRSSVIAESRWSSCSTALSAIETTYGSGGLHTADLDSAVEVCAIPSTETPRRKSSPAAVPPKPPRRLHSDLELDSSDDDTAEKTPIKGMKNECFTASPANDSSPKLPRRSWILWPDEGRSLPNFQSLDEGETPTVSTAGASRWKENRRFTRQSSTTKEDLTRRHSSPTLTKAMAAAIAA